MKRFTIRSLLIAIAVIAGLLALPDDCRIVGFALSFPCLAIVYAQWLHAHGQLRTAGLWFWTLAIVINALYTACSAFPGIHFVLLWLAWLFLVLPILGSFGIAWARLNSEGDGEPGLSTARAGLSVFALTLLPLATIWTAWPSQLIFLMAKPGLERLADQVAAGQPLTYPRWVGPYRIAGSAIDRASGNVGLMTDTSPGGPSGFVRDRRSGSGPYNCHAPFRGDWYHLSLPGGWCYHVED